MKHRFKTNHLLYIILGSGLVGLGLRYWLYSSGYDGKGLLVDGHPANALVFLLTAAVMVLLGLCVISLGKAPAYFQLFPASKIAFFGNLVAAAGLVINCFVNFPQTSAAIEITFFVSGLAATVSLVYLAFCRYGRKQPSMFFHGIFLLHLIIHTISNYSFWSTQVQLQNYFFTLMASVTTLLAVYHHTALDAREGNRKWYVFCNQAALFFCILSIQSDNWLFYLALAVWNGTNYCSLRTAKRSKMALPEDVLFCMQTLQDAGYQAYCVGGCVRDSLLSIPPHDFDLCTDATPDKICEIFQDHKLVRNGEKHGTIGVICNDKVYEITTFRTEGSYTDGRHPDTVEFVSSIAEDLRRRDFTVNAIAYTPEKGYIDPWGGRQDLTARVLRAVGDPETRFTEDSLRILRGVRFAVRFDLTPESDTLAAMETLAPLMDNLARERVFDELCKLLPLVKADDLIRFAPVITQAIPELKATVGFEQHSPHHSYDVYTHTAHVVEAVSDDLALRWAALLHDIGKVPTFTQDENGRGHFYNHAKVSAEMADSILLRLRASNALREQVVFFIEHHMLPLEPDKKLLRRRMGEYGAENLQQLLVLQKADYVSKGVVENDCNFDAVDAVLQKLLAEAQCLTVKDLAITGNDILELGIPAGPQIGACMTHLLQEVQEERLSNESQALLDAAKKFMEESL